MVDGPSSEVWSWRLAAAIGSAHQVVHLAERHPGGGLYDVLEPAHSGYLSWHTRRRRAASAT